MTTQPENENGGAACLALKDTEACTLMLHPGNEGDCPEFAKCPQGNGKAPEWDDYGMGECDGERRGIQGNLDFKITAFPTTKLES